MIDASPPTVDVAGVGLITIDYLFRVAELPAFGASRRASAYHRACGGPVATALACLARLRASCRCVGKVGDDTEGDFLRHELRRQGVDVGRVRVAPGRSRVAVVLVEEGSGERGFLSYPESHPPFSARDLTPADVAGARVVHLDDADEVGLCAAKWAHASGATVVFDGTWQSDRLTEFLPLVDHAIVGEFFARGWLPGADDEDVLRRLVDMGAGTAVLTRGAAGCLSLVAGQLQAWPAFPVDVVDTTGAGDAFHGGFIHGLLQAWPLERSLPFAGATAALNCRGLGGQISLPTVAEVEALLKTLQA